MLTTLKLLFGIYRSKWVPLILSSTPMYLHYHPHDIIEDLRAVKAAILDDLLIIGFGNTEEDGFKCFAENLIKSTPPSSKISTKTAVNSMLK